MADTKRCPAIEFLPGPLPTQSLSVSISRVLPGCKGWFCLVPHLSRSFAEWPLVYDVAQDLCTLQFHLAQLSGAGL